MDTIERLTAKIAELEHNMNLLEQENTRIKTEVEEGSSTFKTIIALKNNKIKELETALQYVASSDSVEAPPIVQIPQQIYVDPSYERTYYTFRTRFSGISRLQTNPDVVFRSDPAKFAGADWVIELGTHNAGDRKGATKDFMSVSLTVVSENLNEGWCCGVYDTYSLYSQDSPVEKAAYTHKKPQNLKQSTTYSNHMKSSGYPKFVPISELFSPSCGYIKDDGILISVDVTAFPTWH
ncbi:hypothetical protein PFISCL1PPCAC_20275 [Pristionchus fissidentatus]|uniref:MATH domain-containing protein n=1 Tax=Pristionchus fissidentatus TaxID=1538716 RepID=A0AAV5WF48_9BILA|nr:hypothetical protein PFISCL1PPCAC_20275 [Pristionchus fissidentatus]